MFELACLRDLRGQDETVETGLVNDGHSARGVKTVVLTVLPVFLVDMHRNGFVCVAVSEDFGDILADEPPPCSSVSRRTFAPWKSNRVI